MPSNNNSNSAHGSILSEIDKDSLNLLSMAFSGQVELRLEDPFPNHSHDWLIGVGHHLEARPGLKARGFDSLPWTPNVLYTGFLTAQQPNSKSKDLKRIRQK